MDRYLDGSNVQDLNVSVSTSVGGSEDADAHQMLETPVPAVTNHVYLGHDAAQFITIYHHDPRGSVGLSSAPLAS